MLPWCAGCPGAAGRWLAALAGGGGGAAKLGAKVEAPGLKLKVEAFGFRPPLLGAGPGCSEGNSSSLSSQLIVSSGMSLSNVGGLSFRNVQS